MARILFATCAGLLVHAACATEASRGSGESHFLECKADADCADAGTATKCVNRKCSESKMNVADATAEATGADTPEGSDGIECPSGCAVATALPITTCREQPYDPPFPKEWDVACRCGNVAPLQGAATCHRRVSDGTAWAFDVRNLLDPSAWTACTPAQEEASQTNCIYALCERPPRTLCLTASFCDAVGCGGVEYDTSGCRRLPCSADGECADDERCTMTVVQQMPCTPALGPVCDCPPPLPGPANTGSFCNPVASAGQRGAWTELEVSRVDGFSSCPTIPCTSYWRIGPDGGVMASRQGQPVTSALNIVDLDRLRLIADGPELRTALRDGIACGPSSTETNITFRLEFGSETLERVATGCVISGPTGNVFELLYNLVKEY